MNTQVNVFIPSYCGPEGSTLRNHRKEIHNRQLIWLLENHKFDKIYVASQGYQSEDYVSDERIIYLDVPPRNPATARNVLLEQLEIVGGIGIFIDNDLTSLATLDSIISRITTRDDWELLGLTYIGKKKPSPEVPEEVTFKRLSSFATGAFAIRAGLGVRFDENLADMEDKEFSFNAMLRCGHRYYQINNCTAWFYYDEGESTIYTSTSDRSKKYKAALEQIKEKYHEEIAPFNGDHLKAISSLPYPKSIAFTEEAPATPLVATKLF
jgi:hypothetical protein